MAEEGRGCAVSGTEVRQPQAEDGAASRSRQQRAFRQETERFLRYLEVVRNLSPHTVRAYREDLEAYCAWCEREGVVGFGATHRQLRRYLAELVEAGYSTRTCERHLSSLRTLYRWLVHEGLCDANPAEAVRGPKTAKTLPKTMSDESVSRLIATCGEDAVGLRDQALLELLYASGARISEASALDVGDVDLSQRQARLFGKGSKERIVPLYQKACDAIRTYEQKGRPALCAKARTGDDTSALFVSTRGRRMSADALRTVFERHVAQAGLDPGLTPHAMRHTFATELLSGGADLRSVQELLGHASLSTTQIYTHLSVDKLREAERQAHPRSGDQD